MNTNFILVKNGGTIRQHPHIFIFRIVFLTILFDCVLSTHQCLKVS